MTNYQKLEPMNDAQLSIFSPNSTTLSNGNSNSEENVDQILLEKIRNIIEKQNGTNTQDSMESQQRKMYECDICQKQFTKSNNRNAHRKRHDNVKQYECPVCKWKSFTKGDMRRHSVVHIEIGTGFSCLVELCEEKFDKISQLKFHLEKSHNISTTNPLSCKKCNQKYTNSRYFCIHFFLKHEEITPKEESSQTKKETKNGNTPLMNLSNSISLEHLQGMNKTEQSTSSSSDKTESLDFVNFMNILQNIQNFPMLNIPNIPFPILQNSPVITSILDQGQIELESSQSSNSGITNSPNSSEVSQLSSSNESSQMQKLLSSEYGNLDAHQRHSPKLYECDICHMQFTQIGSRNRHRKKHNNVKPYECDICKLKFFENKDRAQHSMVHINKRTDFECPVVSCNEQFIHFSDLQNHLKNVHFVSSGNPASCKTCYKKYTTSKSLLTHFHTGHEDIQNTPKEAIPKSTNVTNENTVSTSSASLINSEQLQEIDKREKCTSRELYNTESLDFVNVMNVLQNLQNFPILNIPNIPFPTLQNSPAIASSVNQEQIQLESDRPSNSDIAYFPSSSQQSQMLH